MISWEACPYCAPDDLCSFHATVTHSLGALRDIAVRAGGESALGWEWHHDYPQRVTRVGDAILVAECYEDRDAPSRFAEYISTFNPVLVLALIDALRAAGQTDKQADGKGKS